MRRGVVPVRFAAPDGEDAAVTHVDRDEDALARVRRNRPLAENPLLGVDVVVYGVERIACRQSRPFEKDTRKDFAIPPREVLTDLDVVQVVRKVAAEKEREIGGNLRCLCLKRAVQILERLLQLAAPSLPLYLRMSSSRARNSSSLPCERSMAIFW